jgi:hypothetical protein
LASRSWADEMSLVLRRMNEPKTLDSSARRNYAGIGPVVAPFKCSTPKLSSARENPDGLTFVPLASGNEIPSRTGLYRAPRAPLAAATQQLFWGLRQISKSSSLFRWL